MLLFIDHMLLLAAHMLPTSLSHDVAARQLQVPVAKLLWNKSQIFATPELSN
jgi:hypothetical protein